MATENAWHRFRRWRRSRPFWGGLFLLLSAVELFLSANLTLEDLQVHFGQEGYLSYVLPLVLLLCGVLTWVSPAQRLFYGILGLLTALYSFLGLNLGGFGIGMLLGIVGGALVIAWGPPRVPKAGEPVPEEPVPGEPSADEPVAGDDTDGPAEPAGTDEDADAGATPADTAAGPVGGAPRGDDTPRPAYAGDEAHGLSTEDPPTEIVPGFPEREDPAVRPSSARGAHRKLFVITLVPLVLTLTAGVLAGGHATPARAQDCPKGLPSRSATAPAKREPVRAARGVPPPKARTTAAQPEPEPPAPSGKHATPTPTPSATAGTGNPLIDGWNSFVDGVGKALGIGDDSPGASPSPSTSPSPSPKPSATPSPAGSPAPGPSAPPSTPAATTRPASPSPVPSLSDVPCLGPRVFKRATAGDVGRVSIHGGLLEGKSLNMYDSTYDGTVDLQTADGPVKVLKFSMSKSVTEPFTLTIPEPGGQQTVITTDKLTTEDHVKFYTPRFSGKLFGLIPVTFTPDSPPPLTLPWLYFSDVRINLAFVSCDTLTAEPLIKIAEKR